MSQVTPGGGALKIKLSKKKPLKITAGAPGGLQTIPMELEPTPSPKWLGPRPQVDTTSESTLPTRGSAAPLFISPILPESDLEPLVETPPKRESDLKCGPRHELAREKEVRKLSKQIPVKQGSTRVPKLPEKGNGGDPPEGKDRDQGSPDKGRGPPRRDNNQAGGGEMMILTLVTVGAGMILLPQTPLPQGKERLKALSMYSKDLLDQKVKRVNLVEQEEMVETGRISL